MTVTDTEKQPTEQDAPLMHDSVRTEAEELILALAAVAGDEPAVYQQIRNYVRGKTVESALGGAAAALVLIFAECITEPVEPGEYAPLTFPTD